MIDLHTHTTESDGTFTPGQLVQAAAEMGLEALAITDHDTFAGYEQAAAAGAAGVELIRGIELSTRLRLKGKHAPRSVHMLGYWIGAEPSDGFRRWLRSQEESRRDRNRRLAERLQSLGLDIELSEAEQLGRAHTGRPHFARVLLSKGYVSSIHEAFRLYLGEAAKAYVHRDEAPAPEAIERISEAGGVPSLAHPVRLGGPHELECIIGELSSAGLRAMEAWHSDHGPGVAQQMLRMAERYGLAVTGGSDFHGANKPGVALGTGMDGNVAVPLSVLDQLRAQTARS